MKKNKISVIIALMVLFGMCSLTACGDKNGDSSSSVGETGTSSEISFDGTSDDGNGGAESIDGSGDVVDTSSDSSNSSSDSSNSSSDSSNESSDSSNGTVTPPEVETDTTAPVITVQDRSVIVQPNAKFVLNAQNLGLSVTDNKTESPVLSYHIEHDTVENDVVDGTWFKTSDYGVYIVDAIAMDEAGNSCIERVVLTVEGTYVTDFDTFDSLNGVWATINASEVSLIEHNGGKAIAFTPNNWYTYWNIPMLAYDNTLQAGDEVRIGFDLYVKGDFLNDNWLVKLEAENEQHGAYTEFLMREMYTDQRKAHFELKTRMLYDEEQQGYRIAGFRFAQNINCCPDMQVIIDNISVISEKTVYDWTYEDVACEGKDVAVENANVSVREGALQVEATHSVVNVRFYNKDILEKYSAGTRLTFAFDLRISQLSNSGKTIRLAYLNQEGVETVITPTVGEWVRVTIETAVVTTRGGYVNTTLQGSGLSNLMLYFVSTDIGDIIAFDNLSVKVMQGDGGIVIMPQASFTLSAESLGLDVAKDAVLTHRVTYNGQENIDLTDNTFMAAECGYYEVLSTVEGGDTFYTLLSIEGTFVYGFNNINSLSGTWVCNGSSGSLYVDENGNQAWKLVPSQTTTAATNINIPAFHYDSLMEGQEVKVSFLVKVDGTFTSAAGWGTLLFEKTSANTTIVSQELVSGTNLVDGVYRITLKTKLSYDSGTKNYRISGFKFTTYGSAIDVDDPVSLYIDNIVITWA